MSVEVASVIVGLIGAYLALGAVFALAFVSAGASRIDPGAAGMPLPLRLFILAGAAALWPLMLWKWFRQKAPPVS